MTTTYNTRPTTTTGYGPVAYERQVGTAVAGGLAVVAGVWGGICGYIGPYFGFRPLADTTWVATLQEGLLHVAPGAAAVVAGLMLLGLGPARRAASRWALMVPAVILLAAGSWFVIGPVAWPAIESGAAFLPASALRNLLDVACASYAPGLVMVMLGGMALKAATVPLVAVRDPMTPAAGPAAPLGAPAASVDAPVVDARPAPIEPTV